MFCFRRQLVGQPTIEKEKRSLMNGNTIGYPLKSMRLRKIIRSSVANGEYKAGDRLLSENEMVAKYGVSRQTVREAVGSLVQEGILERFQGRGTFVGAQAVETKDVLFVLCGRDYTDPLFSMTLKGAEERCSSLGGRLVYTHFDHIGDMAEFENRFVEQAPVRGVVVTGILDMKWLIRLMSLHENIVLVGDVMGSERTPDIVNHIVSNDAEAAREAMDYLLTLGHQRIAHITGDRKLCWFKEGCESYIASLYENGLSVDKSLIVECSEEGVEQGYQSMLELLKLKERPTAVFASNDRFAWGAIRAIRANDLSVPDDISVIGMNDLPMGEQDDFLTTMALPRKLMGTKAIDKVVDGDADQPERVIVPMKLVKRQSCAAPGVASRYL
jgi:DNA-binding LacI/PurR family transcriptional regulator